MPDNFDDIDIDPFHTNGTDDFEIEEMKKLTEEQNEQSFPNPNPVEDEVKKDPETFTVKLVDQYAQNEEIENVIVYAYDPMMKLFLASRLEKESVTGREFVMVLTEHLRAIAAPFAPVSVEEVLLSVRVPERAPVERQKNEDPFADAEIKDV